MSDDSETGAASRGASPGWVTLGSVAIFAVAVLAGVLYLARADKAFDISVDKDGEFKIAVQSGDNLADILANAIEQDRRTVEALLSSHGFFHIESSRMISALAQIDVSKVENRDVTNGMREMLWNLDGPFERPGTLAGADERFIGALEELDLASTDHPSELLARIWQHSLDKTSVFRPRRFDGVVVLVPNAPPQDGRPQIYACPGNEISGKVTTLQTKGETRNLVTGEVVSEVFLDGCGGSALSLRALLAGEPARFGLDFDTFSNLIAPGQTATVLPEQVEVVFTVYPRNLTVAGN